MKIGLSSGFFPYFTLREVCRRAEEAGFMNVEADLPKDLGDLANDRDFKPPILSIHAPKILTLRKALLTLFLAKKRSISIIVGHPTISPSTFRLVTKLSKVLDIIFTVENFPPNHLAPNAIRALGVNPNWILPESLIFERFGEVPVTLDIAHAFLSGIDLTMLIKNLGPRLAHVHISDSRLFNEQEHIRLDTGEINFLELFAALSQQNYQGMLILEVGSLQLREQLDFINKFF